MIFRTDSVTNMDVIAISSVLSNWERDPFGSFKGLSIAIKTVDMIMIKIMNGSKYGCKTIFLVN